MVIPGVTITIRPLATYFPRKLSTKVNTKSAVGKVLELSLRWHKLTYAITFVALVAALAILPRVTFDYNLLNMQAQNGEAIRTFKELLADTDNSPWHATALASGREEAERRAQQLAKLPEVTKVVTIFDLVPAEQEEKLSLIEEMALTMGPMTNSTQARPAGGETR